MSALKIWLNYSGWGKLKSAIRVLLIGPVALAVVLIMRLLNPIWNIQVGYLLSHRVGHFIANGAEFIHNKNVAGKSRKSILVTWDDKGISNYFWKKIVSRNAKINNRWLKHIIIWNKRLPGWNRNAYLDGCRENEADPNMMFIQHDLRLGFTEKEIKTGEAFLKSFGWTKGEPYICLQVRDNAYGNKFIDRSEQFEHNYRNSDIQIFLDAIRWLEAEGFWVLRMGKVVETKIDVNEHLKLIDYANCNRKSDFLDIWLFANCTGVISTNSGIDALAWVYRKPALFVNCPPLTHIPYFSDSIFAPKKLILAGDENKQLNLAQCLDFPLMKDSEYRANNLTLKSLDNLEILECVKEFFFHKLSSQPYTSNQNLLQDRAWITITASEYFKKNVKAIHPDFRIADSLLVNLMN